MAHPLSRKLCRPQAGQLFKIGAEEYELAGKLGDGAVGVVRRVVRKRDQAVRAVKFLAPDPKYIEECVFDDVAARFRREGERGCKLDSPYLLRVFDHVENESGSSFVSGDPKNPFLLMELVSGNTLERYIRNAPSEDHNVIIITPEKLDIALQLVEGLEFLHRKKLVHRDVKPANTFVSPTPDGRLHVRLGDFGIVKWGDFHASLSTGVLTATNQRGLGTLKYMSPEQAIAPKNVGVRSDIYSLGITLFELFAGRILASPHHVFEIMSARLARGTTVSRFYSMGYRLPVEDDDLGELLLDMHLRGIQGRPTIDRVRGTLNRAYARITGDEWQPPL